MIFGSNKKDVVIILIEQFFRDINTQLMANDVLRNIKESISIICPYHILTKYNLKIKRYSLSRSLIVILRSMRRH